MGSDPVQFWVFCPERSEERIYSEPNCSFVFHPVAALLVRHHHAVILERERHVTLRRTPRRIKRSLTRWLFRIHSCQGRHSWGIHRVASCIATMCDCKPCHSLTPRWLYCDVISFPNFLRNRDHPI